MTAKREHAIFAITCLSFLISACDSRDPKQEYAPGFSESSQQTETIIKEGVLVLQDSMRIEDPLNEHYFATHVYTTEQHGVYDVTVRAGKADFQNQFTLPKNAETWKIQMQKDESGRLFIIGFIDPATNNFNPYFQVKELGLGAEMKYLYGYNIE